MAQGACVKGNAVVVHVMLESAACHLCMDMLLSSPPPSSPKAWWELTAHLTCPCRAPMRACWVWQQCHLTLQGGPTCLFTISSKVSLGTLACLIRVRATVLATPAQSVTSSRVSPAGGVYLVQRLHSRIHSASRGNALWSSTSSLSVHTAHHNNVQDPYTHSHKQCNAC